MADVEPLPFVPATWMIGRPRSGEPIGFQELPHSLEPHPRGIIGNPPPALKVLSTEKELERLRPSRG